MTEVQQVLVLLFAAIGSVFVLLAAIGVVRMPDLFSRMQSSSKAATLGAACIAIAVALHFWDGAVAIRATALIAFLVLTAPIAAHLIARAGYATGVILAPETVVDEGREQYARQRIPEAGGEGSGSAPEEP